MYLKTSYCKSIFALLDEIAASIPDNYAGFVEAHIVGGAAVHIWTALRVSADLDAIFEPERLLLPHGLSKSYIDEDGKSAVVMFDRNFNSTLGLVHPDFTSRSTEIPMKRHGKLKPFVISPVDLAVMKAGRFVERDRNDIKALIDHGLIERAGFLAIAHEALSYYIGNMERVKTNLEIISTWMKP